jgi:hypothetical protein
VSKRQLLGKATELFEENCEGCRIKVEIEKQHGFGNADKYCKDLCPIGKKMREIGREIDFMTFKEKALRMSKANFSLMIDRGLSRDQMAEVCGVSPMTITRKKKEFGLIDKVNNFNSKLTKELYEQERKGGMLKGEIAAKYNIGLKTLNRRMREWGII